MSDKWTLMFKSDSKKKFDDLLTSLSPPNTLDDIQRVIDDIGLINLQDEQIKDEDIMVLIEATVNSLLYNKSEEGYNMMVTNFLSFYGAIQSIFKIEFQNLEVLSFLLTSTIGILSIQEVESVYEETKDGQENVGFRHYELNWAISKKLFQNNLNILLDSDNITVRNSEEDVLEKSFEFFDSKLSAFVQSSTASDNLNQLLIDVKCVLNVYSGIFGISKCYQISDFVKSLKKENSKKRDRFLSSLHEQYLRFLSNSSIKLFERTLGVLKVLCLMGSEDCDNIENGQIENIRINIFSFLVQLYSNFIFPTNVQLLQQSESNFHQTREISGINDGELGVLVTKEWILNGIYELLEIFENLKEDQISISSSYWKNILDIKVCIISSILQILSLHTTTKANESSNNNHHHHKYDLSLSEMIIFSKSKNELLSLFVTIFSSSSSILPSSLSSSNFRNDERSYIMKKRKKGEGEENLESDEDFVELLFEEWFSYLNDESNIEEENNEESSDLIISRYLIKEIEKEGFEIEYSLNEMIQEENEMGELSNEGEKEEEDQIYHHQSFLVLQSILLELIKLFLENLSIYQYLFIPYNKNTKHFMSSSSSLAFQVISSISSIFSFLSYHSSINNKYDLMLEGNKRMERDREEKEQERNRELTCQILMIFYHLLFQTNSINHSSSSQKKRINQRHKKVKKKNYVSFYQCYIQYLISKSLFSSINHPSHSTSTTSSNHPTKRNSPFHFLSYFVVYFLLPIKKQNHFFQFDLISRWFGHLFLIYERNEKLDSSNEEKGERNQNMNIDQVISNHKWRRLDDWMNNMLSSSHNGDDRDQSAISNSHFFDMIYLFSIHSSSSSSSIIPLFISSNISHLINQLINPISSSNQIFNNNNQQSLHFIFHSIKDWLQLIEYLNILKFDEEKEEKQSNQHVISSSNIGQNETTKLLQQKQKEEEMYQFIFSSSFLSIISSHFPSQIPNQPSSSPQNYHPSSFNTEKEISNQILVLLISILKFSFPIEKRLDSEILNHFSHILSHLIYPSSSLKSNKNNKKMKRREIVEEDVNNNNNDFMRSDELRQFVKLMFVHFNSQLQSSSISLSTFISITKNLFISPFILPSLSPSESPSSSDDKFLSNNNQSSSSKSNTNDKWTKRKNNKTTNIDQNLSQPETSTNKINKKRKMVKWMRRMIEIDVLWISSNLLESLFHHLTNKTTNNMTTCQFMKSEEPHFDPSSFSQNNKEEEDENIIWLIEEFVPLILSISSSHLFPSSSLSIDDSHFSSSYHLSSIDNSHNSSSGSSTKDEEDEVEKKNKKWKKKRSSSSQTNNHQQPSLSQSSSYFSPKSHLFLNSMRSFSFSLQIMIFLFEQEEQNQSIIIIEKKRNIVIDYLTDFISFYFSSSFINLSFKQQYNICHFLSTILPQLFSSCSLFNQNNKNDEMNRCEERSNKEIDDLISKLIHPIFHSLLNNSNQHHNDKLFLRSSSIKVNYFSIQLIKCLFCITNHSFIFLSPFYDDLSQSTNILQSSSKTTTITNASYFDDFLLFCLIESENWLSQLQNLKSLIKIQSKDILLKTQAKHLNFILFYEFIDSYLIPNLIQLLPIFIQELNQSNQFQQDEQEKERRNKLEELKSQILFSSHYLSILLTNFISKKFQQKNDKQRRFESQNTNLLPSNNQSSISKNQPLNENNQEEVEEEIERLSQLMIDWNYFMSQHGYLNHLILIDQHQPSSSHTNQSSSTTISTLSHNQPSHSIPHPLYQQSSHNQSNHRNEKMMIRSKSESEEDDTETETETEEEDEI